ncbi:dipeptidyl peptidase 3 [Patescibacteria group bacterium AH-259-L07]|nr:dipeptidyl peptidase 3 [Patescibacteria group bacterium AH-259-L07]
MNSKKETDRKYLLERVGDIDVAQLYCDDFFNLDPKDKLLAYYLSKAARAGQNIALDQSSPHTLEIERKLISLYQFPQVLPWIREKIHTYLKELWIHGGIYHQWTARKLSLDLTEQQLLAAARVGGVNVDDVVNILIDPNVKPMNCNKGASDIIQQSYNNYYPGLTFDEVEKWAKEHEQHPLNSQVVKENKTLRERVWRTGNKDIAPGMYAAELTKVNHYLAQAMKYAAHPQKQAIQLLMKFFETGDLEDFKAFNIAWVQYEAPVEFILGFIETNLDPRSAKGRYEGIVHAVDTESTAVMAKLGHEARYFESVMPWDDKYKNPQVKPLDFRVVNIIFSCGDAGPLIPIGINLPNDDQIRQQYGSKSVMLKNIMETDRKTFRKKLLREFAWDTQEVELYEKWADLCEDLRIAMHEVLGHASGRVVCDWDPSKLLPGCYATLEEVRADLVALWLMFDPKLQELGLVDDVDTIGRVAYQSYVTDGGLFQLRRVPTADTLEEDHMKNRQLITHYILENSDAIAVKKKNGKTYLCVTDFETMRQMIGKLLAEIMRIKAEGDLSSARALIERYGTKVNTQLRDEVVRRVADLDIASHTAFVMPEPYLVRGDSRLRYPSDLTDQMLRFSSV